jgi:predicted phage terminase large subunit-like protein
MIPSPTRALDPAEVARLQCDLLAFTARTFRERRGGPFIGNWHQRRIAAALERVVLGRCPRLIINVPPRSGKTELAVVNFIAWGMGLYPDAEFIHASYSGRLAGMNTYNVRALMQTLSYLQVFPWTSIKADSSARDEFRTLQGGVVYASGAEGSITGYGAGKMRDGFGGAIIIDDPHKAAEATSELQRSKVIEWFQTTMETRKNRPETPIILIMQRLHEEDLSGFLLAGGNGEAWEHLVIPAIDTTGRSFWERQFPIEDLRRREAANPYVFAGQYMQRPSPKEGGMFPRSRAYVLDQPPAPAEVKASVRYWDKAATAGAGAFTAGVLLHTLHNGRFVLGDVRRGQWAALDREKIIRQTAEADGRRVTVWIEQEPGSGGKESAEATIRNLAGWSVRADRPSGDKVVRAQPYAAQWQGGNLALVRGDWNRAFLDEHELFPMGKYKDQVDASAAAFNLLNVPVPTATYSELLF